MVDYVERSLRIERCDARMQGFLHPLMRFDPFLSKRIPQLLFREIGEVSISAFRQVLKRQDQLVMRPTLGANDLVLVLAQRFGRRAIGRFHLRHAATRNEHFAGHVETE